MLVDTTEDKSVKLARIRDVVERYQLPFTADYLSWKLDWPQEFSAGILREYKRFVVLAVTAEEEITPSRAIDEVWHYHILHTREYQRFASLVGEFLHHNPGGPSTEDNARYNGQYERTMVLYAQTFKEPPPPRYWPGGRGATLRDVLHRIIAGEC